MPEFDPNGVGLRDSGIFGLPFSANDAELILLPVPWDVTVSQRDGTAQSPELIRRHSAQIDLFDVKHGNVWEKGIWMAEAAPWMTDANQHHRDIASSWIEALELGRTPADTDKEALRQVNQACQKVMDWVQAEAEQWLAQGKKVAVVGGDHSTPLGLLRALGKQQNFSILQIDAHLDLRPAYEDFTYSHASIMHNALQEHAVEGIVAVGVREFCEQEFVDAQQGVQVHTGRDLAIQRQRGASWWDMCERIVSGLGEDVYVSFDIDGLEPSWCPATGTPVPGGLTYDEALTLLSAVRESGRRLVGFDLVETGKADYDAMIACRLLYQLCIEVLR